MNFKRFRLVMWAFALAAFFAVLTFVVPKVQLLTVLNGIFLGVVVAAIIVYAPLVWVVSHKTRFDRVSQLSLGIGLLFGSIAGQRFYSIVWIYYGSPDSWQSNYVLSAIAYVSIIGACLFVIAPGYPVSNSLEPTPIWGNNRKLLIASGLIGGIVTFMLSVWFGNY